MLIGLAIRDIVLIESLDLAFGPGLTALTGETGAGKSIILDALGLAAGARAEASLVRHGAAQAVATAIFAPGPESAVWSYLEDKGLTYVLDEDLVLRRVLGADGRSRAFVNDQPTGVGVLRDLGGLLIEVHGQHETVGLLDARTHLPLLDRFGACEGAVQACLETWSVWRAAREEARSLKGDRDRLADEADELTVRLAELDRLSPSEGEARRLAEERAVLGAAEKTLAEIAAARDHVDGEAAAGRLGQAYRALERARQRATGAGVDADSPTVQLIVLASEAVDRAMVEAADAAAAIDAAAAAFDVEPERLERAEERLFALRAVARKLGVDADDLPAARADIARRLLAMENADEAIAAAEARVAQARSAYLAAAQALTAARRAAGDRLAAAVKAELAPLKLEKARFQVAVEPLEEDRAGPTGADKVEFQVSTLPGAPFQGLGAIASGGELARFALALKASLAGRGLGPQPLMIFDEVDQGVGGAVADAVGLRLRKLSRGAQVLAVTHSPQVAARADAHWRVRKAGEGERLHAAVDVLVSAAREEEIARMLSGATVTDAARAAARALMHA
ncbi:MAG TPA: DNA repair protein RecN [Caulobacteraceae bacterium]|nr:DNA repair protein RecN [Caulobacteraceae bacterium]